MTYADPYGIFSCLTLVLRRREAASKDAPACTTDVRPLDTSFETRCFASLLR